MPTLLEQWESFLSCRKPVPREYFDFGRFEWRPQKRHLDVWLVAKRGASKGGLAIPLFRDAALAQRPGSTTMIREQFIRIDQRHFRGLLDRKVAGLSLRKRWPVIGGYRSHGIVGTANPPAEWPRLATNCERPDSKDIA